MPEGRSRWALLATAMEKKPLFAHVVKRRPSKDGRAARVYACICNHMFTSSQQTVGRLGVGAGSKPVS